MVNPVRLTSLGEFGTPQFVAEKLIQAERRKVTFFFFLNAAFWWVLYVIASNVEERRFKLNEVLC